MPVYLFLENFAPYVMHGWGVELNTDTRVSLHVCYQVASFCKSESSKCLSRRSDGILYKAKQAAHKKNSIWLGSISINGLTFISWQ